MSKLEIIEPRDGGADYSFFCPGCQCHHGVWIRNPHLNPCWTFNGDLDHPTFSPSIRVQWPSGDGKENVCHSFVTDGRIQFLTDCTHSLAGQTVEMVDVEM